LKVGKSLFAALDFFHGRRIIHRDLKPQNIMRDRENEIKILDFGIAALHMDKGYKKESADFTIASPFYMSPEQIRGERMDHRSDIYSAGITLFQLTTGQVPFAGNNPHETMLKHLKEPVPSIRALRPDAPYELAEIIEKCMQKRKEDRYQSAKQVLDNLELIEAILKDQNPLGDESTITIVAQTPILPMQKKGKKGKRGKRPGEKS
jgi:serine/threonine protein kinase